MPQNVHRDPAKLLLLLLALSLLPLGDWGVNGSRCSLLSLISSGVGWHSGFTAPISDLLDECFLETETGGLGR